MHRTDTCDDAEFFLVWFGEIGHFDQWNVQSDISLSSGLLERENNGDFYLLFISPLRGGLLGWRVMSTNEELILCQFSFSAWNCCAGFTMKWARLKKSGGGREDLMVIFREDQERSKGANSYFPQSAWCIVLELVYGRLVAWDMEKLTPNLPRNDDFSRIEVVKSHTLEVLKKVFCSIAMHPDPSFGPFSRSFDFGWNG